MVIEILVMQINYPLLFTTPSWIYMKFLYAALMCAGKK